MRKLGAKAVAWSAGVIAAGCVAGGAGCSNDKPTELVPGALSQVAVPRDLDGIEVEVQADGVTKFCGSALVYDGQVELPRTLGVVSGASVATIVTVTIRGFSQSTKNTNFGQCKDGIPVGEVGGPGPQVLRRSIQTFVGQHTLFLPMPLSYSCFYRDCESVGSAPAGSSDTATCAASRCVGLKSQDARATTAKLVEFTPSLVDGTDVCFSPSVCFVGEQRAVLVSSSTGDSGATGSAGDASAAAACTYGFEFPTGGPGLNVKVFFQDFRWQPNPTTGIYERVPANAGEVEILNEDPEEGFTVSAANSRQFTLAPGLCDLVNAVTSPPAAPMRGTLIYHTISAVHAASACPAKANLLPICAGQRNLPVTLADGGITPNLPDGGATTDGTCNVAVPLVPAPSALYMVMDDSAVMHAAFGTQGYATAIGLSLTEPIFKRTFAGFKFLPHLDTDCSGPTLSFTKPDLEFKLAAQAQPAIATKLAMWAAPGDSVANPAKLDLLAAMRPGTGAYAEVLTYIQGLGETPDVAAAMFFINRVPNPSTVTGNDCPIPVLGGLSPTKAAQQALEAQATAAYAAAPGLRTFFVVLNDDAGDGEAVTYPFYQQIAADLPSAVTAIDATSATPAQVFGNFTNVVSQLGTCLYELPAGITSTVQAQITYSIPGAPDIAPPTVVPADPSCTAATQDSANGWNVDGASRLRICGTACTHLRTTIFDSSAVALASGQPIPDVPVNATVLCGVGADAAAPSPSPGPGAMDATMTGAADGATADANAVSDASLSADGVLESGEDGAIGVDASSE